MGYPACFIALIVFLCFPKQGASRFRCRLSERLALAGGAGWQSFARLLFAGVDFRKPLGILPNRILNGGGLIETNLWRPFPARPNGTANRPRPSRRVAMT
jgi:hypothetical protein